MAKKSVLGRGLGALIDDNKYEKNPEVEALGLVNEIELGKIKANPFQPRANFNIDALEELAQSVAKLGIIQPITLRKVGEEFQIISGERRYRAAQIAGLQTIPAYVREADDQSMLEMALVENIQREDLNAIEIAISYQRLIDECQLTQETMSERVGKSRASISNYLRLLKLPVEVQIGVRDNKISMGHARALAAIEDDERVLKIYFQIINEDLSVRKVEVLAKEALDNEVVEIPNKRPVSTLPDSYLDFKKQLALRVKQKIDLKRDAKGKGKLIIPFNNDSEFEELVRLFNKLSEN
jgi:ParB family chromosome partitioning protein